MRQPHVSRSPWRPPANPPRDWRPWAGAIVGMAAILVLAFVLLWVLPVVGGPVR
jgi:hypothetical protein